MFKESTVWAMSSKMLEMLTDGTTTDGLMVVVVVVDPFAGLAVVVETAGDPGLAAEGFTGQTK